MGESKEDVRLLVRDVAGIPEPPKGQIEWITVEKKAPGAQTSGDFIITETDEIHNLVVVVDTPRYNEIIGAESAERTTAAKLASWLRNGDYINTNTSFQEELKREESFCFSALRVTQPKQGAEDYEIGIVGRGDCFIAALVSETVDGRNRYKPEVFLFPSEDVHYLVKSMRPGTIIFIGSDGGFFALGQYIQEIISDNKVLRSKLLELGILGLEPLNFRLDTTTQEGLEQSKKKQKMFCRLLELP